jgi:predicted N-acyltransferase
LTTLAGMRGTSSVHATFLTDTDAAAFESEGFLPRTDQQFHWTNRGYGDFDAFLGDLASRKRKAIKRERREAVENGISIHWLTGSDITEEAWDAFFDFYMETGSRKWGRPYLTREFYSLIGQSMAEHVLLVMAKREGRWIAGAINFIGSDTLYGRNWGCVEDHPFLHFEVCYHQAIEFAIARGLTTVEAGAQGEHKLARGYLPVITRSAHYIADPGFRRAVAAYLERERGYVESASEELSDLGPFRRSHDEP